MRTDESLLDGRAILLNYCNNSYVLVATELNQSIRESAVDVNVDVQVFALPYINILSQDRH